MALFQVSRTLALCFPLLYVLRGGEGKINPSPYNYQLGKTLGIKLPVRYLLNNS